MISTILTIVGCVAYGLIGILAIGARGLH
jgi:hypothetical protein